MQLAIQEPYMLTIQPDDFFISPRRLDENFGTMICFHRRYDLGDEHNYGDNEDFLKDLYLKTVGNDEKGEEKYDRLLDRLSKQPDTPFGSREYACAVNQALMAEIEKEHIVLPLYLYDHSALAMSTDSFIGRVPFPVSWTVKMKKKQKETQDILSYHTQAAGCSDKARAKASGGRQPIEECGRTGL